MPDITIVIPTIKEEVRTLESIPADFPVIIERKGSLNEARNRGVRKANTNIVAIMDDDISFTENTLTKLTDQASSDVLLGIEDWDFDLTAGRVMVFYKSLWEDVGGFDERLGSHMGDTEFALKALKHGYQVEKLPRDLFDHEEHERSITIWDRTWRMAYLMLRYPTAFRRLLQGVL